MDKEFVPVLFEKKGDCCGCSACFSVCPTRAITMVEDSEGFLYPLININKCIGCKTCLKVCSFKIDKRKKGMSF